MSKRSAQARMVEGVKMEARRAKPQGGLVHDS